MSGNRFGTAPSVSSRRHGLGESFLTWTDRNTSLTARKGGSGFCPGDERQIGLLRYMLKRFDHVGSSVSVQEWDSDIYEYLRDIEHIPESPKIAQLIAVSKIELRPSLSQP